MVKRMVTCKRNAFYNSTRDTKMQNWQLWINLSAHSYILIAQNIKKAFLKYC